MSTCAAGFNLPDDDQPCRVCGATGRDTCGRLSEPRCDDEDDPLYEPLDRNARLRTLEAENAALKERAATAEANLAAALAERDEARQERNIARAGAVQCVAARDVAEAQVARLTERVGELEAARDGLYAENQRLRWRHPNVIPEWNDLPQDLRTSLVRIGGYYADEYVGSDFAVQFYAEMRKTLNDPDRRARTALAPEGGKTDHG